MKLQICLGLLFLAGMFACQPAPNENTTLEEQTPEVNPKIQSFDVFLKQFNQDTGFQLSRIAFPLEVFGYEEDEHYEFKEVSVPLPKEEWEHTSLNYGQESAQQTNDAFTQNVVAGRDSAFVQFRGVDNGIYVDYVFVLKKEGWYLVAIKDYSM